ncbi:hypothetical protein D3C85_1933740 [compost metagenome]
MINGGTNDPSVQPDGDIHAVFDAKHFDRYMPLVMVACHDNVEIPAHSPVK